MLVRTDRPICPWRPLEFSRNGASVYAEQSSASGSTLSGTYEHGKRNALIAREVMMAHPTSLRSDVYLLRFKSGFKSPPRSPEVWDQSVADFLHIRFVAG